MITPAAVDAPGSIPPNAGSAEAPAPTDLFAALMDLLGALPLPGAEAIPQEGAAPESKALESEAPEAEPDDGSAAIAEISGALASLLAVPTAPAAAIAQPTRASLAADEAALASPSPRIALAALLAGPALAGPALAAPADGTSGERRDPGDGAEREPEARDASALAALPEVELAPAPAPAAHAALAPPALAPASPRAERDAAPAEVRIAAALGQRTAAIHAPNARGPELGLEPVAVDATASEAKVPVASALSAPSAAAPAERTAAAEPSARAAAPDASRPVTERIVWLAQQGGGSARLELSPPELGQVEIVVRVRGRRVEVHVRAEEAAAQQIVRDCRERLEGALAARDLHMDGFSVNGGASSQTGGGSREAARDASGRQQSPGFQRQSGDPIPARDAAREIAAPRIPSSGAIDLRV